MPRPIKWRKIENIPGQTAFIPVRDENIQIENNVLKFEELEAIRLKDLLGYDQVECAEKMEVSRPTFQRILLSAREKIADSLVNGKGIQVRGGKATQNICRLICSECGYRWVENYEKFETVLESDIKCPKCESIKVLCEKGCRTGYGFGNCRRGEQRNNF